MNFKNTEIIHVYFHHFGEQTALGKLVLHEGQILFEYDTNFIQKGIEVSPLHLPLKSGVQTGKQNLFEGLPGLFNDSLPDGWGRLLLDRAVLAKGIPPQQLTPLDRLTYVGQNGMGALVYEPQLSEQTENSLLDLDSIAQEAETVLQGDASEMLQQLIALGGSSAGARPKALVQYHPAQQTIQSGRQKLAQGYEHWLVKFPSSLDLPDIALIEQAYAQMAQKAGIEMMDTTLIQGASGKNYFATKRFDRLENERIHVHTASGLLNASHRYPSLDYEMLMRATLALCKDIREVEKVFRLAVFNVYAHNRDDHSKNFSFKMDKTGNWFFAPAYDLTFSYGPGGEHSTMVLGEGKNPTKNHFLKLAEKFQLKNAPTIIDKVKNAISQWQEIASSLEMNKDSLNTIKKQLKKLLIY